MKSKPRHPRTTNFSAPVLASRLRYREGLRAATFSIVACALLSLAKIVTGLAGNSTAAVADGIESGLDMISSMVLMGGLAFSLRPADTGHPYGHERAENASALALAILLLVAGVSVGAGSLMGIGSRHQAPALYTIWPVILSILLKAGTGVWKSILSRRIGSTLLKADAFNDTVDVLSGITALAGILLARHDPSRFLIADHIAGAVVALIIVGGGLKLLRTAFSELMDEAPPLRLLNRIERTAAGCRGVLEVHKIRGRRAGTGYFIDIDVHVDPELPVHRAHLIGHRVKTLILERNPSVRDVMTHVEPASE